MNDSQLDDLAQGLHAILCGGPPERWQQAMPTTQERYRAMVRYVLDNAPPSEAIRVLREESAQCALSRDTWQKTCEATELQLEAARKERDDQQARADDAEKNRDTFRTLQLQAEKVAEDRLKRIDALEKAGKEAWSAWFNARSLSDCARQLHRLRARSVASVEADPPQARITAEDGVLHIPAPPDRTPSQGPAVLAVAPELSGCRPAVGGLARVAYEAHYDSASGEKPPPRKYGAIQDFEARRFENSARAVLAALDAANPDSGQPAGASTREGEEPSAEATVDSRRAHNPETPAGATESPLGPPTPAGCSSLHAENAQIWEAVTTLATALLWCLPGEVTPDDASRMHLSCAEPGSRLRETVRAIIQRGQKGEMLGGLKDRRYAEVFDEQSEKAVAWGEKGASPADGEYYIDGNGEYQEK